MSDQPSQPGGEVNRGLSAGKPVCVETRAEPSARRATAHSAPIPSPSPAPSPQGGSSGPPSELVELVERVAVAMWTEDVVFYQRLGTLSWDSASEVSRGFYRRIARAALREISDVIYEQWPNDVRVGAWLARCGSET